MVASGNDFVIFKKNKPSLPVRQAGAMARQICDRKFGAGADGLLVLGKSQKADIRMRIFNPDGSEAAMCGNGARCAALYTKRYTLNAKQKITIETKAGIIESEVKQDDVRIRLTGPRDIKLNIPIKLSNRNIKVNFINTGVPHTVIFVEGLDKIDVAILGRQLRYHKRFAPAGTNVDFVEVLSNDSIKVRTYERGVEDETLACGTGAVAAALIVSYGLGITGYQKIKVHTKSTEILKVYFDRMGNSFKNVWLEGKTRIVYKGCWCDE